MGTEQSLGPGNVVMLEFTGEPQRDVHIFPLDAVTAENAADKRLPEEASI